MRWTGDRSNGQGTGAMDGGIIVFLRFNIQRLREEERKRRKEQIEENRPHLYTQNTLHVILRNGNP